MTAPQHALSQPAPRVESPWRLATFPFIAGALGLLAAQRPALSVLGILLLPVACAILFWPSASTLVVLFILYTNLADVAVEFPGVPFIVGASFALLLLIPLVHYVVVRREKLIITPALPLVVLFLGIQLIGLMVSERPDEAAKHIVTFLVEGLGLYFIITNVIRTPEILRKAVWALMLAGALMGAVPLYQQVTGTFDSNYGGLAQVSNAAFKTDGKSSDRESRQPRLCGSVGEQNRFAQVMLMLVPIGMFLCWSQRCRWLRIAAAIATGLCVAGVALTFSRGAFLGMVVMLAAMVAMRYISLRQLAIVLVSAAVLLAAVPQFAQRAAKLKGLVGLVSEDANVGDSKADGSLRGRASEMMAAGLIFLDHPIVGVGPGQYRYHYREYSEMVGLRVSPELRQAHNLYLGIAAEHGLLGLGCFGGILFVTFRELSRARRKLLHCRPEIALLAAGFTLAIITYLTTGIGLHLAYVRYFWVIMAVAGATAAIAANQPLPAQATAKEA